jgi:hypothetical protein
MEESAMANREQRSNREKKKPKKEKPKGAPVVSTFTTESGKGYSQEKVS